MKRLVFTAALCLAAFTTISAQTAAAPTVTIPVSSLQSVGQREAGPGTSPFRYGYCSLRQLVEADPSYVRATQEMQRLRQQYEREAEHNEADFRRQFSEYLAGQKDFPQPILLKRQHDLQEAMEKGLAFRQQADSLLVEAEREIFAPIRRRVEGAIRAVATERGYDCVVNTDLDTHLYLNPTLAEDITAYVEERLRN